MKFLILLALVGVSIAKPVAIYNTWPFGGYTAYNVPTNVVYNAAPAVTYSAVPAAAAVTYTTPALTYAPFATKTQYHAQDELGQASFGYSHPGHARAEVRDAAGGVRGSYAYIGADGKEVRVNYVADSVNGFRVESNALPVGPAVPEVPVLVGPAPVQDTPEVAEAKAQHAKLVEEAIARNAEADKKDAAEAPKEAEKIEEDAAPEKKGEEEVKSRRKRGAVYLASPQIYSAPALTYAAAPALTYAAAPALTYAAAPAVTYTTAAHVPTLTYSAPVSTVVAAAPAVRAATLTKVVNTPGHAVSYRVD
jgi:hypothetical protein